MARESANAKSGRKAAGAVVAVAILQVVAAITAFVVWFWSTIFEGNACSPECDWVTADRAGILLVAFVVGSFVLTIAAGFIAWRTAKDLAWVPLVGIAVIVLGLVLATLLIRA